MAAAMGINYGQIANNLPSPENVVPLVKSIGASTVKLYDADPRVLKAFANTNVEFIVGLGNEYLTKVKDPASALTWVKTNVQAYLPATKITCIAVGNEVLTLNDTSLSNNLLPAMNSVHTALVNLNLDKQVTVTTAHQLGVLETSYPPSSGTFRRDLKGCIVQILDFHVKTGSSFLINAYPYFAYKNKLSVQISETGWPSKGDGDEAGATVENAKKYNGNLLKLISQKKGTPLKPNCELNVFVFALFNENMKPGPTSERNYGLFKPDGTPAYSLGFNGSVIATNTTSGGSSSSGGTTPGAPQSPSGYLSISSASGKLNFAISWFFLCIVGIITVAFF